MLIPTSFRSPLPGHLSYPVGAEAISKALLPLPAFSITSLSFHAYRPPRQNEQRLVHPVLTCSYDHRTPDKPIERLWYLTVDPVPRALKPRIQSLLLSTGLVHLRAWLTAPRTAAWFQLNHTFSLSFHVPEGALVVNETNQTA